MIGVSKFCSLSCVQNLYEQLQHFAFFGGVKSEALTFYSQGRELWQGLLPNCWNQTLCLVPSPSIKKQGQSVGWLPEQGKDGITTSLSLPEQPDCTCIHMQKIWTVFLPL